MGYRHVDTAEAYGNEESVVEGIATAAVDREDVFLATKVNPDSTGVDYDSVLATASNSLECLGVDSLALLYVRWPLGEAKPPRNPRARAYRTAGSTRRAPCGRGCSTRGRAGRCGSGRD